jgi:hypothetical protein
MNSESKFYFSNADVRVLEVSVCSRLTAPAAIVERPTIRLTITIERDMMMEPVTFEQYANQFAARHSMAIGLFWKQAALFCALRSARNAL